MKGKIFIEFRPEGESPASLGSKSKLSTSWEDEDNCIDARPSISMWRSFIAWTEAFFSRVVGIAVRFSSDDDESMDCESTSLLFGEGSTLVLWGRLPSGGVCGVNI